MGTGVGASIGASLSRTVTGASEALTGSIDSMEMPFEAELSAKAVVDDDAVNEIVSQFKSTLVGLKDINVAMRTMLLNPAIYTDSYSSSILNNLTSALLTTISDYTAIKEHLKEAALKLNPDDHYEEFTTSAIITLSPSMFGTDHTYTLESLIRTYVQADGTGLSATVEEAIWNRARARITQEAGRIARRINTEFSKRLPYSGALVDLIIEADENTINMLADVNNKILEEQGRLAYQSAIDKINQAIAFEKDLLSNFHQTYDRLLKAYVSYDDTQIKIDGNAIQNFHQTADRKLRAFTTADEIQIKQYAASIDVANMVYQNRRDAINSAINIEQMFRQHFSANEDRKLRAYTAYDEMAIKNHWAYFETLMRKYLDYLNTAIEFLKSAVYSPNQLTFNNWLEMSKVMADGQLRIAAMVGDLMPSGQTL